MLTAAAFGFINHLLGDEDWARVRLKPFAGQTVHLVCGPLKAQMEITAQGDFSPVPYTNDATVNLVFPSDTPWRALGDRSAVLAAAQINGSAELVECLGFVFRNLRWDVEEDLSRVIGNIAARRLIQGSKTLAGWQLKQARNFAQNLAEYLTEENPLIARQTEISAFSRDVSALVGAINNLENRIDLLSARHSSP